jgi:tRNA threonylcarbamoyladenosine biosynthesis protein TsaE
VISLVVRSVSDTHAVAAAIAGLCRRGDVLVLAGEMGAGKTAFAQGFGRALDVDEPITSPTFTLVHSYDTGRLPLHHADLYRLDRVAEVADLALLELAEDGILLVEWGDAAPDELGDHLEVLLGVDSLDENARHIEVTPVGRAWETRRGRLVESLDEWTEGG